MSKQIVIDALEEKIDREQNRKIVIVTNPARTTKEQELADVTVNIQILEWWVGFVKTANMKR